MKKTLTIIISIILVCGCIIGGTVAWLIDSTETITNTFTIGDINISLEETGMTANGNNDGYINSYKMIPGSTITKDPAVTVEANSEKCWLFVSIVPGTDLAEYVTWTVSGGW